MDIGTIILIIICIAITPPLYLLSKKYEESENKKRKEKIQDYKRMADELERVRQLEKERKEEER